MQTGPRQVGVFIPRFESYMETKDVGQLIHGFLDTGCLVTVYTFSCNAPASAAFPIVLLSPDDARRASFWNSQPIAYMVCYTWLSLRLTGLVKALAQTSIVTAIKLDSDGRLGHPLRPSYLRGAGYWVSIGDFFYWLVRSIQWLYPSKLFNRRRLEQIALADYTIIESPRAKENLSTVLTRWQQASLIKKLIVVPNPVTNDIINSPLPSQKDRSVVLVGRWRDRSKNRELVKKVLRVMTRILPSYSYTIIGKDSDYFSGVSHLTLTGPVPHDTLVHQYLSRARILFLPSRWEGFNLSASEAVCMGATIVGGPLECLFFLTQEGTVGSIAAQNTTAEQLAALRHEIDQWERGMRDPAAIAAYWRSRLNRTTIATTILSTLCQP